MQKNSRVRRVCLTKHYSLLHELGQQTVYNIVIMIVQIYNIEYLIYADQFRLQYYNNVLSICCTVNFNTN